MRPQFLLNRLTTVRLAGQEGLEPPALGFGDRCSTIELLAFGLAFPQDPLVFWKAPERRSLLRFLVRRVLAAKRTILAHLEALGGLALVLVRGVVPVLALRTLQADGVSHDLWLGELSFLSVEPMNRIELLTSSLPRMCSAN